MIELTEPQKKVIANGLTAVSVAVVVAFVATVAWGVLKVLAFASAAIVPVLFGFFLALFFKPYYGWWKNLVKNPSLALVAMLLTVFLPIGFLLW